MNTSKFDNRWIEEYQDQLSTDPRMTIINGLPFWFWIVKRQFPSIPLDKVGMTLGDYIYTNDTFGFNHPQKIAHEAVHAGQQHHSRIRAIWWWVKYLRDPEFRFNQELEGYQAEYQWVLKHEKNKQTRWQVLQGMAKNLASEHYGSLIKESLAAEYISSGKPVSIKNGVINTYMFESKEIEMVIQPHPIVTKRGLIGTIEEFIIDEDHE